MSIELTKVSVHSEHKIVNESQPNPEHTYTIHFSGTGPSYTEPFGPVDLDWDILVSCKTNPDDTLYIIFVGHPSKAPLAFQHTDTSTSSLPVRRGAFKDIKSGSNEMQAIVLCDESTKWELKMDTLK